MEFQPPAGLSSRERILWAALSMLGEDPPTTPSVRAVAARAGVSAGSVQHHFPNQRILMTEALGRFYDALLPDGSIHDTSIPPRDRLVNSLLRLLTPAQAGTDPREEWLRVIERYARNAPTDNLREEYLAIERSLRQRIEYCLTVLQDEGALAPGDNGRRARFLYTVVSGTSIAQALPAEASLGQTEIEVLRTAAGYVLDEHAT